MAENRELFMVTLRVGVLASTISEVDDDAIADAVIALPNVIEVTASIEREFKRGLSDAPQDDARDPDTEQREITRKLHT